MYRDLGHWICRETTKEGVVEVYLAMGQQRYGERFANSEVLQALILARRHRWLLVLRAGFPDTALHLQQALDLNAGVVLFFDRAMYYAAVGYEQAAAETAA